MPRDRFCPSVLVALLACVCCSYAVGADWPAYGADAARSGVTAEKLTFPLSKIWAYEPPQAPRPAWPEPGRELHRLDFDYAPQPVAADGLVYFGSTVDDTVRALDAATGELRWRFTTGGPIRFAPAVADGRCYVASDDGWLYCLDGATGEELWRFHAAPAADQFLGNGRMVSRWPLRSGVLVEDGVVYVTAGMWPAEGIYVYALDAVEGTQIWCNDSSGDMYIDLPHPGASAFTGVAPQGYLLCSGDLLLVPTGRSVPAAFDRRTGSLLYYRPAATQWSGSSWAAVAGDLFFNPKHVRGPDVDIYLGEADLQPGDAVAAYSLSTGRQLWELPDTHRVLVAEGTLYALGGGQVQAIDLESWRTTKDLSASAKWTVPHARGYCLALADTALLVGGRGSITALDASTGGQIWDSEVEGQVRGIGVAGGRLTAATDRGSVLCFAHGDISVPVISVRERLTWQVGASESHLRRAAQIVKRTGTSQGYALVVGQADSGLATALALRTDLHVINVLPDAAQVATSREALLTTDLYGSRVVVQALDDSSRLPYAPYFADLVVVSGQVERLPATELYRVLRPCGGVLCLVGAGEAAAGRLIAEAGIPESEVRQFDSSLVVVRGSLPGAGEWRHQWADGGRTGIGKESRLQVPLELLWFGGPGPDRMMSRHWATSTPLSVNGRVFVTGQHHVIAFNAYNGLELWCREMQGVGRVGAMWTGANFVADDESVYVAMGSYCHRLDQATGKTLAVYNVPETLVQQPAAATRPPSAGGASHEGELEHVPPEERGTWGYLAVADDLVLGSHVGPEAPLNESAALFALNKDGGALRWDYVAEERLFATAIAFGGGRIFLIDATSLQEVEQAARRGEDIEVRRTLLALDMATGAELWRQPDLPAVGYDLQYASDVVTLTSNAGYDAASGTRLWQRQVQPERHPVIYHNWIVAQPQAYDLRTGAPRMASDILTGQERPWKFPRAYGCGPVAGCENMLFFRSGTAGFFDFAADGTTTFGGVRAGCAQNMVPANGLMIMPVGDGGCTCGYNFQTSVAWVPGPARGELWHVFHGETSSLPVKHVSVNFGAPGDRRDASGAAWLGFPRPIMPGACPAPVSVLMADAGWYYRPHDGSSVTGTDCPWLYKSGVHGQGKIVVVRSLEQEVEAPVCEVPPEIDGILDDACWQDARPVPFEGYVHLRKPETTLFVRRDVRNLYFAYSRKAAIRDGTPVPFVANQTGDNAQCWLDDDVELFLTDQRLDSHIQFGVSCAGGRFAFLNVRQNGAWQRDEEWQGEWRHAVSRGTHEWSAEVAIPLQTLSDAGIDTGDLQLNLLLWQRSGADVGMTFLKDPRGRSVIGPSGAVLAPIVEKATPLPERPFTVRLHFAELDDVEPGQRVFTVLLQGKPVLKDFDIVRQAGGRLKAIVKEFKGVEVGEFLQVELVPGVPHPAPEQAPLLNGIELIQTGT